MPDATEQNPENPLEVSIIVPTVNEALNLPPLMARIDQAMHGAGYEVLIVDDNSGDDTSSVCENLARQYPLTLLIRREPKNGLSGAVLHGMEKARGKYLVVMDADLQHPPERLPELLEPVRTGKADFVLGSRYVPGGSTAESWTLFRRINSGVATFLARPFAGKTTDPMSGFFAMKRANYQAATRLTPLGYKIALELMCKCRVKNVREIPIHFGTREQGESKLSLKQQFRYLEHLSRLYDFTYPRTSPVVKFLIAVCASWMAGLVTFLMLRQTAISPIASVTLSYLPALVVTTLFHFRYVNTQREFISRPRPWVDFTIISLIEWVTCLLSATWVIHRVVSPTPSDIFCLPFAAATLARYVLRKEFMQDIRGLRRDPRAEEVMKDPEAPG